MAENNKDWIDTWEAARITGYSYQTLINMRCRGGGPDFFKVPGGIMYSRGAVEAFVSANGYHERKPNPRKKMIVPSRTEMYYNYDNNEDIAHLLED